MVSNVRTKKKKKAQECYSSQLHGVQGSTNLFHEFKVRQMRLNESGRAKTMITK